MKIAGRMLWFLILILVLILFLKPKGKTPVLPDGKYENCYMLSLKDGQMTVFAQDSLVTLDCRAEEEKYDKIVDISVKENRVVKITWKDGLVEDKVEALNLSEGWINLSRYGKRNIAAKGKLYIKTGQEVHLIQKAGSLLNREKVLCYVYEGEICALITEGEESLQNIRVLLQSENKDIFHEMVRLTGTKEYQVTIDGAEQKYPAGKEISFSKDMGYARVSCPEGTIKLLSMKRAYGFPEYEGEIYIYAYEEGFLIRNHLKLEEYLCSVVSSEMPSSYPEEALKAQAVCARTYALYQMKQAYYGEYGAHVDDTVNSQVYNNVRETESTKKAVKTTVGQYVSYENEPISAYFYSTSCGTTSDVKDVWIGERESLPYLSGRFQGIKEEGTDFSDEKIFGEFLCTEQTECFEKEESWFRWEVKIEYDELTEHVDKNMNGWIKNSPSYFKKQGGGNSLGKMKEVRVDSRSKGGVVRQVSLIGEKGELQVSGEYQIRKALCPEGSKLTLNDGNRKESSMLPSGYFIVKQDEKLLITGGGYGHGVGMSQNGAKAMAELKKGYEEILSFYYPGTELLEMY